MRIEENYINREPSSVLTDSLLYELYVKETQTGRNHVFLCFIGSVSTSTHTPQHLNHCLLLHELHGTNNGFIFTRRQRDGVAEEQAYLLMGFGGVVVSPSLHPIHLTSHFLVPTHVSITLLGISVPL